MTLEINEEAIAYINGLSGQDVKRAFLLDYMLEKIEKSATVKTISFNGRTFKTDDKELIEALSTFPFFCQKTYSDSEAVTLDKKEERAKVFEKLQIGDLQISDVIEYLKNEQSAKPNISLEEKCDVCKTYPKIENSNKCESCHSCIKHIVETSPEFAKYRAKPNYSAEEIEIVKSNVAERKVTEQASELLKFDQLDFLLPFLTEFQIEAIIVWMNSWEQLKGTAIPLRFKGDSRSRLINREDLMIDNKNHLCWIYNRLINFGENPNFDYMHKLLEIAVAYNENSSNRQELEKAFNSARAKEHNVFNNKLILKNSFPTFEDYYKTLKKE